MIKPYYNHKGITIYHADCRDVLPQLEPVDLVLTDPDYNAKDIGPNKRKYENPELSQQDEYKEFCSEWFSMVSVITDNIIFTPGIANTHNYPQPYWILCWHKPAAVSFNRLGGYNAWEPIFIYGKPFIRLPQDYLLFNTKNLGIQSEHPCPKPFDFWKYIVSIMKNGIILDPFMGSGTTLVAAKQLGRKAIGIEIEEKYCEIAVERLKQEVFDFSQGR